MTLAAAVSGGVGTAACLLSLPGTCELLLLTVAALWRKRSPILPAANQEPRMAVVVPAHNEELGIGRCIESLRNSGVRGGGADIIVVADNCSDRTAGVAASAGARVLVRHDSERRGKGHTLQFAFESLIGFDYDAFLVVDADTTVDENFVAECALHLQAGMDAIQCRYLVSNGNATFRTRLMKVALLAFNVLRPRGRERLGLSCGIYGNGFGMRRETLLKVPYRAWSVVEDVEYHLRLIDAGLSVRFVETTAVYAEMPVQSKGIGSQRERWEGGRLRLFFEQAPKLAAHIASGRFRKIEPLLDLLLLPLAIHVALLGLAVLLSTGQAKFLGEAGLLVVALHTLAAAGSDGDWPDVAALAGAPFYILWKLTLFPRILKSAVGRQHWIRTERAGEQNGR